MRLLGVEGGGALGSMALDGVLARGKSQPDQKHIDRSIAPSSSMRDEDSGKRC